MMTFLFSQLLGLAIFCTVNFALYCFIAYKRNQAFRAPTVRRPLRFHFATAILVIMFSVGFGYRIINIRDGIQELYTGREITVREEQSAIIE